MSSESSHIPADHLAFECLCRMIADKQHQWGAEAKKTCLAGRLAENAVYIRKHKKGDEAVACPPLERAWVPAGNDGHIYIYCLWVQAALRMPAINRTHLFIV